MIRCSLKIFLKVNLGKQAPHSSLSTLLQQGFKRQVTQFVSTIFVCLSSIQLPKGFVLSVMKNLRILLNNRTDRLKGHEKSRFKKFL